MSLIVFLTVFNPTINWIRFIKFYSHIIVRTISLHTFFWFSDLCWSILDLPYFWIFRVFPFFKIKRQRLNKYLFQSSLSGKLLLILQKPAQTSFFAQSLYTELITLDLYFQSTLNIPLIKQSLTHSTAIVFSYGFPP